MAFGANDAAGAEGSAGAPPGGWTRGLAPALLVLALLAALSFAAIAAGRLARERATDALNDQAAAALPLAAAALVGVVEKQRLIPTVLARDPEVIAHLAAPAPAAEARLDEKLAEIVAESGATVIYLVDKEGEAIAASNAGEPGSFVGSNYGFRDYFSRAMRDGSAAQFALGTVSGRPGLYLSRRVDSILGPLGVVVVKVEFDELEARWRDSGFVVLVTDPAGVILVTSRQDWRFDSLPELAAEGTDAAGAPPAPVTLRGAGLARIDGEGGGWYARATGPVGAAAPDWKMTLLAPAGNAPLAAARNAQVIVVLAGVLLAAAGLALARRRRGAAARQAALARMNAELESRVAERTEDLNRSNSALAAEIAERESAEDRVRRLRDDLAQANRLSILGQIAAGVAHEINQPIAAIRAYAETGAQLIDVGQTAPARENLGEIVRVTERVGAITQMLRGFARRGAGETRPVAVGEAIDGALSLLAGRVRDAGAVIERAEPSPDVAVLAGRIRLEQILVNLLQNALDALRDHPDPRIAISVAATPAMVAITIRDNGRGLSPEARGNLFIPFATTKATGLGLGLVISGDIAREFGGDLRLDPEDGPGASFTLELPRAP